MEIFDIIGPVMVGPSSSHTAGVVRIGKITRSILGQEVKSAKIKFHGSFAKTYHGHGSDKAVVAGLMGYATDDERIRESFKHADEAGLNYSFEIIELSNVHPNTIIIEAAADDGKMVTVQGESIGGGNVVITKIDSQDVEFTGEYNTLIINHKDAPGTISLATNLLATLQINIASMKVYRTQRSGDAIMIIETDQEINHNLAEVIEKMPNMNRAKIISAK